jgi:VanZ family protein
MIATIERRSLYQYWRWALVVAWMGVIFYLSSRSTLPRPKSVSADLEAVAGHFTAYAVLALLVSYALSDSGISAIRRLIYAVVFAVMYGVSDEIHQSLVPGRDPAMLDICIDALGAITALAGWQFVRRRRNTMRKAS